ncbi:MAG: universal stress protein [Deltaproteobacteria bacterium]|nr:universal stress protein [Deltaproteobacteria bacterium]
MAAKNNNKTISKILLPTDFTGASEEAAAYALTLARRNRAKLYVLHVVDTSHEAAGFYLPHLSYEKLDKDLKAVASEMLERFCARTFKGYKSVERHVLAGEPYKEILKVIKGGRIDLVVMGTYGKEGIDRFFFGSTTERVMRKASCPVLVIPPTK